MKKYALATALIFLCIFSGIGIVVWRQSQPQGNSSKERAITAPTDNSASSLGVTSSSAVPLGNLPGENGASGDGSSISMSGGEAASPQSGISVNGTSTQQNSGSGANNNATLDPKNFGQYDQYKSGNSAMFGEITVGNGTPVANGKKVAVLYRGWLTNGKLFDENVDSSRPFVFTFGSGSVIPGWEQGLAGMKVGGERLLIIPPSVGYGSAGTNGIPANSVLVFDVKVIAVE